MTGNKRRVVITGMGLISSIGNTVSKVTESLRHGRSGIEYVPEFAEAGLMSHIAGTLPDPKKMIAEKSVKRFMCDGAAFAPLRTI